MLSRRKFLILSILSYLNFFFSKKILASDQNNLIKKIIPKSKESISPIGMGTWLTFDVVPNAKNIEKCSEILKSFFKHFGQVIDSSPMYGSAEKIIGLSLDKIQNKKDLFSATKIWTTSQWRGVRQIQNSFDLWKISKFSLIQVHNLLDYKAHKPTLIKQKQEGKIKYIGVTTSHGRRHEDLIEIMKKDNIDFVQFTYNLLDDVAEKYLLPLAKEKNIAVMINRPFQGGNLFSYSKNKKIPQSIKNYNIDNWPELYLKFIISHPAVTCVIPATSKIIHMEENMKAQYGNLLKEDQRIDIKKFFKTLV